MLVSLVAIKRYIHLPIPMETSTFAPRKVQ